MDSGIYQIVVDAHAPRSRFEQDPVAQGVGARQQRPALPVGSGEGLLAPCRRPRLQVVIQKASPGEVAPEMLHRLCSHEPRQIAAEKLCELFLPFFGKFEKFLRCHCLECKRNILLLQWTLAARLSCQFAPGIPLLGTRLIFYTSYFSNSFDPFITQ